jgi:hypothetical protein
MSIRYSGQAADDAALKAAGLGSITQWTDILVDAAVSGGTARTDATWREAAREYGRTHDGYIPGASDTCGYADGSQLRALEIEVKSVREPGKSPRSGTTRKAVAEASGDG